MKNQLLNFLKNNLTTIVVFISIVLSIASFIYYYQHGLTTEYVDAKGHLNIARRVGDNLTPGFAQLGGVWLPLFHLLMLPTIWDNFMWHSGISGSIISMPAYIIGVYFMYKLILLLTKNKLSALIGTAILGLNINLLYMQSTPMTEAIFVTTIIIAVYMLLQWAYTKNITSLLISGIFFFLGTMTRYEAWPLAMGAIVVVAIISIFTSGRRKTEGTVIIFSMLALVGIFLWLSWQTAIFHDPFYFLHSEFSAKGQTAVSIAQGDVPTYKNVLVSFKAYFFSLVHVNGLIVTILAIIGIIVNFINNAIHLRKQELLRSLPIYILFIPGIFLIYALYKGNIPVSVPEIARNNGSPAFFNIRYALYSLPAIAVFTSMISAKRVVQAILIVLILVNTIVLFPFHGKQIATLVDATSADLKEDNFTYNWLRENYKNGLILASATTSDSIIFNTGIDMKNFITEGSGKYWNESMKQPSKYANWAIITDSQRDMASKHMNKKRFLSEFKLIKNYDVFKIYKRTNDEKIN